MTELLEVDDLHVAFPTPTGVVRAVDGITFALAAGEAVGLVGESGSGKSVAALSIMGLLGDHTATLSGAVRLGGQDLRRIGPEALRAVRGRDMAMVFQDPATSLNPVLGIVAQVAEVFQVHLGARRGEAVARAVEVLRTVGIADAGERTVYPHQLSGGMRQRVMIAMAIACEPRLLIADEPTTALDVTVAAQILRLLGSLVAQRNSTLLLISHDLGVIAGMTTRMMVMYAGRIVEIGPTDRLFARPQHHYTLGLLRSVPRLDLARPDRLTAITGQPPDPVAHSPGCPFAPRCAAATDLCHERHPPLQEIGPGHRSACWHPPTAVSGAGAGHGAALVTEPGRADPAVTPAEPMVVARNLRVEIGVSDRRGGGGRRVLCPVDDVDLSIPAGHTLGLVGESGCGKTTLGRALLMLHPPTGGQVRINGADWSALTGRALRRLRRHGQMIFQDPFASFDPRVPVRAALTEALRHHPGPDERDPDARDPSARADELLVRVGLDPRLGERYPHECSGGQLQRVAVARALAPSPAFVVADEPTSSLDVSIQAQMMTLMADLQDGSGLTYLFISHNLAVVRQMATEVAVMYLGRLVEIAPREELFARPLHPYTRALVSAVPHPDPPRERRREPILLTGDVPSLLRPPPGCRFHPRCPAAMDVCRVRTPRWVEHGGGHRVACHLYPGSTAPTGS